MDTERLTTEFDYLLDKLTIKELDEWIDQDNEEQAVNEALRPLTSKYYKKKRKYKI